MDTFEFDWEVLEIIKPGRGEDRRGALVTYTPLAEGCSERTIFVPVPWHKATDPAHAREILERKINSRAPTNVWRKELNPDPPDQTDAFTAELEQSLPPGEKRESGAEQERSRDSDNVSESSGSERERSGADGVSEI